MNGLLINGKIVDVPGVEIANATTAPWAGLHPRDFAKRKTSWVRQIILHTTKGIWPQVIKPGVGPAGRAKHVADFWRADKTQSAAHIVVGSDGKAACLADLATIAAFHATVSNDWSIGIEIYQEAGGVIYQAALDATLKIVRVLCAQFGIQYQCSSEYVGEPIARMFHGGRDCVGIFGHRDNTDRRGRGDPGDAIFDMLRADGCEEFDFCSIGFGDDRDAWADRQRDIADGVSKMIRDGIPGPGTVAALKSAGYRDGIWAFGKR